MDTETIAPMDVLERGTKRFNNYLEATGNNIKTRDAIQIVTLFLHERYKKLGSGEGYLDTLKYKKQAKRLKNIMSSLGIEIKLGHAFNAISIIHGHKDWNTLSGLAKRDTELRQKQDIS